MYEFIKSLINAGGYRLDAMERTIERHYVRGDLTDAQRVELLQLAADHADESKEIDIVAVLADLECPPLKARLSSMTSSRRGG